MKAPRSHLRIPTAALAAVLTLFAGTSAAENPAGDPGSGPRMDVSTPPGRLIDIGDHRLHIHCLGHGAPTIVLDAGLGGFSLEWLPVQRALAADYRVCAYDRSGYGWSESGGYPRTTRTIVRELRALLLASGEQPPYLLVGHSFGGYTAQHFAQLYPRDTAGLVLVDSSHPGQQKRFPPEAPRKDTPRGRTMLLSTPMLPENFPSDVWEVAYHLMLARKAVRAQRFELDNFARSGEEVEAAGPLPDVPVAVLTRGERVWRKSAQGDEMERIWTELQNQLAAAAPRSEHIIAVRSGHYIHLDEPGLVERAVRSVARVASCAPPVAVMARREPEVERPPGEC